MRHKSRKQATRYTRPDYDRKPQQTRQPRPVQDACRYRYNGESE